MKKKYQHIVLATDGLMTSEATHTTAFNLAKQHGATITIVDTLIPPSTVSRWLSSNASDVFEMVLADKLERLEHIAEQFRSEGVETQSKVLFGKSSEAITREAIESSADLVVRYKKGVRSKYPGTFGNTSRSLMKFCPCPLLLVDKVAIENPTVLACIDAEHDNHENLAILDESSRLTDNPQKLLGLYCWELSGAEILGKRMAKEAFEETLRHNEEIHRKIYEKFANTHDLSAFEKGIQLENGPASTIIPNFCERESVDIAVMCSASLNHQLKRLLGSTVESVMDKMPCSLLVVKPHGFASPIKPGKVESATPAV